jgi:hypothetical protein
MGVVGAPNFEITVAIHEAVLALSKPRGRPHVAQLSSFEPATTAMAPPQ